MFGIHFYDENYNSPSCANFTGVLKVTNNVVINQTGPAINISTRDINGDDVCWSTDIIIENNFLYNVGLSTRALEDNVVPPGKAIAVGSDTDASFVRIINNTIYHWGSDLDQSNRAAMNIGFGSTMNPDIYIDNNTFVASRDNPYLYTNKSLVSAQKNSLFSEIGITNNYPVEFTNSITANPELTVSGSILSIDSASPLINTGYSSSFIPTHDLYGVNRANIDIGAVESEQHYMPTPKNVGVTKN